jgi:hypothetical protein
MWGKREWGSSRKNLIYNGHLGNINLQEASETDNIEMRIMLPQFGESLSGVHYNI